MGVLKKDTKSLHGPAATKISSSGNHANTVIHRAHVLTKKEVEMNRSIAYTYAF